MNTFNEIIKKIGEELNIKVTLLSDNWLTILEKDNEIHYIQGYKFELNNHGIGNIMDDKGLFYDLCQYKGIPIIEHKVIFSDYNQREVLDYFHYHDQKLIIKGNIGTCGKEVFLVNNKKDLFIKIDELLNKQFSISLCPFYDILNEYRVIVLNKKARVVYGKKRPEIIGDGVKTVYQLACDFNPFYQDKKDLISNPSYIPEPNEKVLLNYQFNLSNGAVMFLDINDELKKQITALALFVAEKLDISFGSIDIIYTVNHELFVMEANSGVMMDSYIKQDKINGDKIAYHLYRDAVKLMFENSCKNK